MITSTYDAECQRFGSSKNSTGSSRRIWRGGNGRMKTTDVKDSDGCAESLGNPERWLGFWDSKRNHQEKEFSNVYRHTLSICIISFRTKNSLSAISCLSALHPSKQHHCRLFLTETQSRLPSPAVAVRYGMVGAMTEPNESSSSSNSSSSSYLLFACRFTEGISLQ